MNRRQWPLPSRPGWYLEVGPVPDRKSPYLTVISPHGMHSIAQISGVGEAETLAECLDALLSSEHGSEVDG